MSLTPTQLTLRTLRDEGWTAAKVEHWDAHAGIRRDLFGIIDVVAIGPAGTIGVQATSDSNVAARVNKIADAPTIGALREAGWQLEVWGWRKKDGRWIVRRVDVS